MKQFLQNINIFLVGLLILIWPMPHTIAIRNIDIVLLFITSFAVYKLYPQKISFNEKKLKYLFYGIIMFLGWALFISLISPFRNYCIKELNQLTKPVLLIFIAYFLINSKIDIKKIFITIFAILMVFSIYHSLYSIHYYLLNHHLPFRSYGITVDLDGINFLMPYILAFFAMQKEINEKNNLSSSKAQ